MHERLRVIPGQRDLGGMASLGVDPKRTALLRSSWDVTPRHLIDLSLRHSGELGNGVVPGYTVFDARFGWRPTRALELSLAVQNALDRDYSEWGSTPAARALLARAFFLQLSWRPS